MSRAGLAADLGHGDERREAELPRRRSRSASVTERRVAVERRPDDLVVRRPGLQQQPAAAVRGPPTQAGRPDQQRQGLLGGPVAGGEQLLVEVEERHDVGVSDPVQHGLGADEQPARSAGRRRRLAR